MTFVLLILSCSLAQDAVVIQPLPRDQMTHITTSPPCGGVPKGKSHLLSQPGSLNKVSWKILKPAAGNCTVKLIYGNEYTQQHTLLPEREAEDSNGVFRCGENSGVFAKVFRFPAGVSCDSCTLQWVWVNNFGTFYHCIDVEITELTDSACYGRCKNGGYCSEGMCICQPGFFGTFCDLDGRSQPVRILSLLITIIVLAYFALYLSFLLRKQPTYTHRLVMERLYPGFMRIGVYAESDIH